MSNFFPPQNHIAVRRILSFAQGINLGPVTVLTTKKDPRYDGILDPDIILARTGSSLDVVQLPYCQQLPHKQNDFGATSPTTNIKTGKVALKIKKFVSPDLCDRRLPFLFKSFVWLRNWKRNGAKPLFVLSSSPIFINHIIGFFASRIFKSKWIVDYRDLWTLDPFRRAVGPFALIEKVLEKLLVSQADLILTVSEGQKLALKSLFPSAIIEVIFNGVDAQVMKTLQTYENFERTGPIKFLYLGTVIPENQVLNYFFDALREMRQTGNLPELMVEFYGSSHTFLSTLISAHKVNDFVKSHPKLSHPKALEQYAKADILLFLDWMEPRVPGVLTGKLFEYIASGAEIISLTLDPSSEANMLIKRHDAGVIVLNQKEAIKSYLCSLSARLVKLRAPRKVRSSADEFSRERIAKKLTALISDLP